MKPTKKGRVSPLQYLRSQQDQIQKKGIQSAPITMGRKKYRPAYRIITFPLDPSCRIQKKGTEGETKEA